jgi:hypothetical protein
MKSYEESAQEYQEFVVKISKAGKDFCDAVNSLSPENLKVFKREMRKILPAGFTNLIKALQD